MKSIIHQITNTAWTRSDRQPGGLSIASSAAVTFSLAVIFLVVWSPMAHAYQTVSEKSPDAQTAVYKTMGDIELSVHIFNPEGHKPSDRRPAALFFSVEDGPMETLHSLLPIVVTWLHAA